MSVARETLILTGGDVGALLTPARCIEAVETSLVALAEGPAAGLEVLDRLVDVPSLKNYHHLPAVRGDLLVKLGRKAEAGGEFQRAAKLTSARRASSSPSGSITRSPLIK